MNEKFHYSFKFKFLNAQLYIINVDWKGFLLLAKVKLLTQAIWTLSGVGVR